METNPRLSTAVSMQLNKRTADSKELQIQMRPQFIAIIQSTTAVKDSRMVFGFFYLVFPHVAAGALSLMISEDADITAASLGRPESEHRWVPPHHLAVPPRQQGMPVGFFSWDDKKFVFNEWLSGSGRGVTSATPLTCMYLICSMGKAKQHK